MKQLHHHYRRAYLQKLIKKIWLPIIILGLTAGITQMKARKIECYTQFGTCPKNILDSVNWLSGYPLFKPLPVNQVKSRLSNFEEISGLNLYRRLPSTLIISISLRHPVGSVGTSVLGARSVVDENGLVFKSASVSTLPILLLSQPPSANTRLSAQQVQSLKIMSLLVPFSSQQVTGVLTDTTLSVMISLDMEILVDIDRPISEWYPSLQLILNRSKIMAKMPHKIDLRFSSSIISY
jgi:cell division septal protein FtsQ